MHASDKTAKDLTQLYLTAYYKGQKSNIDYSEAIDQLIHYIKNSQPIYN